MKEQIEEKNTEMGSVITRSEEFIQKNQKTIWIVLAAIVVVVLGIIAVRAWYIQPREENAANEMFAAQQWMNMGDYQKALEGDDNYAGLNTIIDEYGSTKAGNLARYYAGIANLRMGNFEEALDLLKDYKAKDELTKPLCLMLQGDCLAETGNLEDATGAYKKAAGCDKNYIITPTALWKEGMALLALGNADEAKVCFETVKKEYPRSSEYNDIDKYIGMADAMLKK